MIFEELYQEIILDHYKMPRNFFVMEAAHCHKEVKALCKLFHSMLTEDVEIDDESLDELMAMEGVKKFPMRVKCATLSWHSLSQAIDECQKQHDK